MKNRKLNLMLCLVSLITLSFSVILNAQPSRPSSGGYCLNNGGWPTEISSMLLSSYFYQLNTSLQKEAKNRGQVLRLSGCSLLQIEKNTYGFLSLQIRPLNIKNQTWKPVGHIVSKIIYAPNGEINLDGMWFEPIAEPPGGATVGN